MIWSCHIVLRFSSCIINFLWELSKGEWMTCCYLIKIILVIKRKNVHEDVKLNFALVSIIYIFISLAFLSVFVPINKDVIEVPYKYDLKKQRNAKQHTPCSNYDYPLPHLSLKVHFHKKNPCWIYYLLSEFLIKSFLVLKFKWTMAGSTV